MSDDEPKTFMHKLGDDLWNIIRVVLALAVGVPLVIWVLNSHVTESVLHPPPNPDPIFLAKMHSYPYWHLAGTDDQLISMARTNVCGGFDQGETFTQITYSLWGPNDLESGYVIGAGVSAYCPQYKGIMISEINALNGN